jgi:hypothetical protein
MSGAESLEVIADRLESVRSVSAPCDIVLTDPAGQTLRLDGVMLAQPPDHLRLRAWKLGQAVLDFTLAGEEAWLMKADEARAADLDSAIDKLRLAGFGRLAGAEFFRGATEIATSSADSLAVEGPVPGAEGGRLVCVIDRRTLTPRRFSGSDAASSESLLLEDYRVISGRAWPTMILASSPRGEIRLHLYDVEIDADLPDGAFTPPTNAVRLR